MMRRTIVARAQRRLFVASPLTRSCSSLVNNTTLTTTGSNAVSATAASSSFLTSSRRFYSDKPTDAVINKLNDDDVVVEDIPADAATPRTSTGSASATGGGFDSHPVSSSDDKEHVVGVAQEKKFRTETRQLLDIVACSLYSDKEVFIREIVSNASDALEKRRHLSLMKPDEYGPEEGDEDAAIFINVKQSKNRFVIRDTGVGMTAQELEDNLGTIASSGSKAFVRHMQESGGSASSADKIIGQFGVGFYSIFMVANYVRVYSRSSQKGSKGYCWESDGTGSYKITECEGVAKGTKIVLDVKDLEVSFCTAQIVDRVIKRYSNFLEFPIALNDTRINTVEALWMKSREEVSNEQHIDFYKFISGSYDSPQYRLHYSVDAPLTVRALLYVPLSHTEKYGGARMEPGVNLYCRRVLIQSKCKALLPEWLRFVKGAVDSESIPLNISREHTQDGSIMRRLNTVITKRIIRWMHEESRRDKTQYEKFIKEFGNFLKEGVCTDSVHKSDIAKLLRYESTKCDESYPMVSLDDYANRMKLNQTHIYYIQAPSKELAMASPYYEQYKDHDLEVLILTDPIDDFVMQHLESYSKHKLQNIEMFDCQHDGSVQHEKKLEGDKESKDPVIERQLSSAQITSLSEFITKRLLGKVGLVKSTTRLRDSPAVIADHESAQMRKLYKMAGQNTGPPPKYNLQINPKHEIIRKIYSLQASNDASKTEVAGLLIEQVFDNAIIAAGLLEDPRAIVNRLNTIMGHMVKDVEEPPQ